MADTTDHGATGTRHVASASTVRTAVLLSGGPKPSPLAAATGRAALDLMIGPDRTVLELWLSELAELTGADRPLEVRVVHERRSRRPADPAEWTRELAVSVSIEPADGDYRGAAGVIRDATDGLDPSDTVLVSEAARLPTFRLRPIVELHFSRSADVTVATNPDGSPAGLYLIRREALDGVQERGYSDLKEQWLAGLLKAGRAVWAHRLPTPGSLPLRTPEHLLAAAAWIQSGVAAPGRPDNGHVGDAVPTPPKQDAYKWGNDAGWCGRIVASDAAVDESSTVLGSVVMPGAVIGPGCVVARSIVCPGATVQPGTELVDAVVR